MIPRFIGTAPAPVGAGSWTVMLCSGVPHVAISRLPFPFFPPRPGRWPVPGCPEPWLAGRRDQRSIVQVDGSLFTVAGRCPTRRPILDLTYRRLARWHWSVRQPAARVDAHGGTR